MSRRRTFWERVPYKAEKRGDHLSLAREKEPNWAFEALRLLRQQNPVCTKAKPPERNKEPGKHERGVSEDSSLHLNTPEKAVMASLSSVLLEQGTPSISVDIEGVARRLILDTGSNVSILQPGISRSAVQITHVRPYGVTGEVLDIKGQMTVPFVVDGPELSHVFSVLATHWCRGSNRHLFFERSGSLNRSCVW